MNRRYATMYRTHRSGWIFKCNSKQNAYIEKVMRLDYMLIIMWMSSSIQVTR